eukprot:scaffold36110_cov65-Phaeocystis_antarctica.AAC.4
MHMHTHRNLQPERAQGKLTGVYLDHALLHPHLHWRAAVGAQLHPLRAGAAYALVAARHGEVRLRVGHAHDACGHAAEAGFGDGVAPGDVAHIGEGQHRLSRRHLRLRRLCSRNRRHCMRARGRTAMQTTPTTPAAPTAPAATYLSTAWQGYSWRGCGQSSNSTARPLIDLQRRHTFLRLPINCRQLRRRPPCHRPLRRRPFSRFPLSRLPLRRRPCPRNRLPLCRLLLCRRSLSRLPSRRRPPCRLGCRLSCHPILHCDPPRHHRSSCTPLFFPRGLLGEPCCLPLLWRRHTARLRCSRRNLDPACVFLCLLLRCQRRLPRDLGLLATRVGWDVIAVLLRLARFAQHSGRSTSEGKERRSNHGGDHRGDQYIFPFVKLSLSTRRHQRSSCLLVTLGRSHVHRRPSGMVVRIEGCARRRQH